MSSNVIDEMIVKVGVDASEYRNEVEKLTESNDKLEEGLENTEKQFEKTTKKSRENSTEVKNANDEYGKFNTNLGSALSSLAKIGAGAVGAGVGMGMFATSTAKANHNLTQTAKNIGEMPNTLKKFGYAANAMGVDSDNAVASMVRLKSELNKGLVSGDQNIFKLFNDLQVDVLDKSGKARGLEHILFETSGKLQGKSRADAFAYASASGLSEDLFNMLIQGRGELNKAFNGRDLYMPDAEAYKNAEELTKSTGELKNSFSALGDAVTDRLTPSMISASNALSNTFDDWVKKTEPKEVEKTRDKQAEFKQTEIREFNKKYGASAYSDAVRRYSPKYGEKAPKDVEEFIDIRRGYMQRYEEDRAKNDLLGEQYGEEFMQEAQTRLSSAFSRRFTRNDWRDNTPEENEKKIADYLEILKTERANQVSGDSGQSAEGSLLFLGKTSDFIKQETEEGNTLIKETNQILKKQDSSAVLRSIDQAITKLVLHAVPQEPTEAEYIEIRDKVANLGVGGGGGSDREKQAISYFMSKGWSKAQAVGIVANLKAESGLKTGALNPNEHDGKGNQFSSKGLAQWNRGRLDNFKKVFGKDISQSSYEEQLAFVQWELENTEKNAASRLRATNNAGDATESFMKYYERPANQQQEAVRRRAIASGIEGNSYGNYADHNDVMNRTLGRNPQASTTTTNTIDVKIGDLIVNTSANTVTGVANDAAEEITARLTLNQLTTGVMT